MNNIYKATFDQENLDYQKIIRKTGEEIEITGFYKTDKHILSNPPDHKQIIDKLTAILKGSGISKITIIFLNKNL